MHKASRVLQKGAVIFPAAFLLLFGLCAHPATAATRDEQTKACKKDALRLCALSIPNEAKITACMEKKYDRLSPGCQAMFTPSAAPAGKREKKTKNRTE